MESSVVEREGPYGLTRMEEVSDKLSNDTPASFPTLLYASLGHKASRSRTSSFDRGTDPDALIFKRKGDLGAGGVLSWARPGEADEDEEALSLEASLSLEEVVLALEEAVLFMDLLRTC